MANKNIETPQNTDGGDGPIGEGPAEARANLAKLKGAEDDPSAAAKKLNSQGDAMAKKHGA